MRADQAAWVRFKAECKAAGFTRKVTGDSAYRNPQTGKIMRLLSAMPYRWVELEGHKGW